MLGVVVSLAIFAVVIYTGFWLMNRRRNRGGSNNAKPSHPSGPIGPDDDEDFLRGLNRQQRHSKGDQDKDDQS